MSIYLSHTNPLEKHLRTEVIIKNRNMQTTSEGNTEFIVMHAAVDSATISLLLANAHLALIIFDSKTFILLFVTREFPFLMPIELEPDSEASSCDRRLTVLIEGVINGILGTFLIDRNRDKLIRNQPCRGHTVHIFHRDSSCT